MKIFAIRNNEKKDIAYLLYYENNKKFYIEINDNLDIWDVPPFFDSFIKKDIKTVNSYLSELWVKERIVPSNRQNIGQILKNNKLSEYDEYKLLIKNKGRCVQDSLYLELIKELPNSISKRNEYRLSDILCLDNNNLLVFFRNDKTKKINLNKLLKNDIRFKKILENKELFNKTEMDTNGYGISFSDELFIDYSTLYDKGKEIDISLNDFKSFVKQRVVDTKEASNLLNCSKQNIDDLINRDKLEVIKESDKYKLFLKGNILKRTWR